MTPKKIVVDCDPGIDDALALALAHGSPALELLGVTTVGGNVGLHDTTGNALRLREFLGFPGVPVTAGSANALLRTRVDAARIHGAAGLGGRASPSRPCPPPKVTPPTTSSRRSGRTPARSRWSRSGR